MKERFKAALPSAFRSALEEQLPEWCEALWFETLGQGIEACRSADIGWLDTGRRRDVATLVEAATSMRWLNTYLTDLDGFPLALLKSRNVLLTNGSGLSGIAIAEYVLLGMLHIAKGFREVVRAQDRREWLHQSPGRGELAGSKALLFGYGAIAKLLEPRLDAFGVDVTIVRRSGGDGQKFLGPGQWRERLGEFDWLILLVPSTAETVGMLGAAEIASMKHTAVLLNFSRGTLIDQSAVMDALKRKRLGGAFLDVVNPEPLDPENEMWALAGVHMSMHLSGRSHGHLIERSTSRFIENLHRYREGRPLNSEVNLDLGY